MNPIMNRIIENSFQDFAGLRVGGRVVLSDQLINEVLQLGLESARQPTVQKSKPEVTVPAAKLDIQEFLNRLDFEQLDFRSEAGKVTIEIKGGLSGES